METILKQKVHLTHPKPNLGIHLLSSDVIGVTCHNDVIITWFLLDYFSYLLRNSQTYVIIKNRHIISHKSVKKREIAAFLSV
jgi:hypothetical protein